MKLNALKKKITQFQHKKLWHFLRINWTLLVTCKDLQETELWIISNSLICVIYRYTLSSPIQISQNQECQIPQIYAWYLYLVIKETVIRYENMSLSSMNTFFKPAQWVDNDLKVAGSSQLCATIFLPTKFTYDQTSLQSEKRNGPPLSTIYLSICRFCKFLISDYHGWNFKATHVVCLKWRRKKNIRNNKKTKYVC